MYRTQKYENFMSAAAGNMPVTVLPGIGEVRGGRLNGVGITTVDQLLSRYVQMGSDRFESFLNQICGQNSRWTGMTMEALKEYNEQRVSSVGSLPPASATFLGASASNYSKNDKYEQTIIKSASPLLTTQESQNNNSPNVDVILKDKQKLLETIECLQSRQEGLQQKIKELFEKTTSNERHSEKKITELNDKLSSIAGQLAANELFRLRTEGYLKAATQSSNDTISNIKKIEDKVFQLDEKMSTIDRKLVNFFEKMTCLELRIQRSEGTISKLKEIDFKKNQEKELFEINEHMRSHIERCTQSVKMLREKTEASDKDITDTLDGLNERIASKNNDVMDLSKKVASFAESLQTAQEMNEKLNNKLYIAYCVNALLFAASTFLFIKKIK